MYQAYQIVANFSDGKIPTYLAENTWIIMRPLLPFLERNAMFIKVLFHTVLTLATGGLWLLGLIIYSILKK
jgi:hypothetical protein